MFRSRLASAGRRAASLLALPLWVCYNAYLVYGVMMSRVAHVRLDDVGEAILDRLTRETGKSPSEIVREGLRMVAAASPTLGTPKVVGLGGFESGTPDLGSNKAHLGGFGR